VIENDLEKRLPNRFQSLPYEDVLTALWEKLGDLKPAFNGLVRMF